MAAAAAVAGSRPPESLPPCHRVQLICNLYSQLDPGEHPAETALTGPGVDLTIGGRLLRFPAIWLRDNCPCPGCVAPGTTQKVKDITDMPNGVAITRTDPAGDSVTVTFAPDQHRATLLFAGPGVRGYLGEAVTIGEHMRQAGALAAAAAVTEPVRLHVAAERYLRAAEPGYSGLLSAESVRTLALQGGPDDPGPGRRVRGAALCPRRRSRPPLGRRSQGPRRHPA